MTDTNPTRRLLTRDQVIAALRAERGMAGLSATARKYELRPQQIADVLAGRAAMSRRMYQKLKYKCHEFFERIGD